MPLSFDQSAFQNMFQLIGNMTEAKRRADFQREQLKMEKDLHQHRIREMDLAEKVHNFGIKKSLLEMMQGQQAPDVEGPPTEQESQAGVSPSQVLPGVTFGPDEGVDQPTTVVPRSMQQLLTQQAADRMAKINAAVEQKRRENALPPPAEKSFDVPAGTAPEIFGPKGGSFSTGLAGALGEIFKEKESTKRAGILAQSKQTAADQKNATTPDEVEGYWQQYLARPESLSSFPIPIKNAVMKKIGAGAEVPEPTKSRQVAAEAVPAIEAIHQGKQDLDTFLNAVDPISKITAAREFQTRLTLFSRMVIRAAGDNRISDEDAKAATAAIMPYTGTMGMIGLMSNKSLQASAKHALETAESVFMKGMQRKRAVLSGKGMGTATDTGGGAGTSAGTSAAPGTADDYLKSIGYGGGQ